MARMLAPVAAGLATGIAIVVVFTLMTSNPTTPRLPATGISSEVSDVVIPEGASNPNSGKTFEPQTIKVVIGVNNTVRWTNNDIVPHWIEADDDKDPDFFRETTFGASSFIGERHSYLNPGEAFEYTFTKPGEFGYHGQPWESGTVIVVLPKK